MKNGRYGGREPNVWKPGLTSKSLRAFREEHRISRVVMSKLLNVSASAIVNWEGGLAAPSSKTQDEMERIMKEVQRTGIAPSVAASPKAAISGGGGDALTTTGTIVSAYLASAKAKPITQDGLLELVRAVRSALS